VWQQIDLQAHPTLSSIKKRLRQIENTIVKKDFFFVSSSFTKEEAQRDSSSRQTQGFLKFLGIFWGVRLCLIFSKFEDSGFRVQGF
jgi:hypothetical protein